MFILPMKQLMKLVLKEEITFFISSVNFFQITASDWLYLIVLSSICTAYAFIASVQVMKYLSPYTVMLTINLEPIYAIVLALFIFGDKEQMSSTFYLGAFIVLFVVLLNGIIKNKGILKEKFQQKWNRKK